MIDNPSLYMNGFTTVEPWLSHEIDQHPDAARIWATVAKHGLAQSEDAVADAEAEYDERIGELKEKERADTLEEMLSVLQRLNLCVLNEGFDTDRLTGDELADYDDILEFLEASRV